MSKKKVESKQEVKAEEVKTAPSVATKSEPVMVALSVYRKEGAWTMCRLEIQGDKVLSKKETVLNEKAVALHDFKIAAADEFFLDK